MKEMAANYESFFNSMGHLHLHPGFFFSVNVTKSGQGDARVSVSSLKKGDANIIPSFL